MALFLALVGCALAGCGRALASSRLTFGSCCKHDLPQPLWPQVLERDPAGWIWGGDIVYGDYIARYLPRVTFEARGVEYLRSAYRAQARVAGYAELRERVPIVATWDDHDFGLNDADRTLAFREGSLAAFREAFPEQAFAGREGVYSARALDVAGGTVLVVALDMRYEKTPYAGRAGPGDFLGEAQWAWLAQTLNASRADAHVFVSSLQLLEWRSGTCENWGRFPESRARFLDLLQTVKAPIVVSGDVHMAEIAAANCGSKVLVDVTSSGLTHSWARQTLFHRKIAPLLTNAMRLAQLLLKQPYLIADETTGRTKNYLGLNFGELDFDFETRKVHARVFGEEGLALEHAFDLDALGVAGTCEPIRDVPAYEAAARMAAFVAITTGVVFGTPLVVLAAVLAALRRRFL